MSKELGELERDANIRGAFVNSTAIQYRALCQKGLGPQQLHEELNNLDFNRGKKLTVRNIAAIVNYCYYPRNIELLRELMAPGI